MFPRRNKYIFSYKKKRRAAAIKRVITIILIVIAVIIALFAALVIYNSKIHISLVDNRKIEINTEATASQFIEEIGNGRLVQDVPIDTTVLGKKDCNVKIKVGEEIRDYSFTVQVVDTQAPELTIEETSMNLMEGTPVDVLSKASATDNSGEEIPITIEGEYDENAPGTQVLKLVAADSSGNKAEQEVTINVIGITADMPDTTFLTTTGHKAEVKDGILTVDGILIVNKSFGLPESYGEALTSGTWESFQKMANAAAGQGLLLDTVTEFRSYGEQAQLYNYWSVEAGEGPNTMSAVKPGHSEHQTGLAIDVNSTTTDFADTAEGKWLNDNCWKYGFIMRYPKGKEDQTGCSWEPWHIRYIAGELPEKLYNNGDWITLEEYFGIPSKYL